MKKKILVVDDEAGLLKLTLLLLDHSGYEAFGAETGQGVTELARQTMPDLIILDVLLPGMNGDEVAQVIKKDPKLRHIPILLISAEVETLKERARESEVEGYLFKPFESEGLIDMIEKCLPVREAR